MEEPLTEIEQEKFQVTIQNAQPEQYIEPELQLTQETQPETSETIKSSPKENTNSSHFEDPPS
jgi:hypothetical protein